MCSAVVGSLRSVHFEGLLEYRVEILGEVSRNPETLHPGLPYASIQLILPSDIAPDDLCEEIGSDPNVEKPRTPNAEPPTKLLLLSWSY